MSRHNYNKHNLVRMGHDASKTEKEILTELKLYKIHGPGNKRFVWKRHV